MSLLNLLDLSAAFDSTDHDILLHRLENVFGIQNSAVSFFRSYLTERSYLTISLRESKWYPFLATAQILPLSIKIGQNDICSSRSVWDLGVIFDDKLSMKQVSKTCWSAYLELHRISSVRHVLTFDATNTLVTSLVLSCLDYCNSLLSGIPQRLIDKLQKIQNCSAQRIFKTFRIVLLNSFSKPPNAHIFHPG